MTFSNDAPVTPAVSLEITDPDHYNKLVLKACKSADLTALETLLKDFIIFIDPTYDDSAAWKFCVKRLDSKMCKLFLKYFGTQFFYNDKSVRNACIAGDREIAMFILGLIVKGVSFIDMSALQEASRKGHTEFVMKVLNEWAHNTHCDLTWACVVAMMGCIYGKHEALFDTIMAKYKAYVLTVHLRGPEFKIIKSVLHINRKIMAHIAGTRNFEFFNKALNELDMGFETNDDTYVNNSGFTGYTERDDARLNLFSICCDHKDSRMIDALIAKYGLNLFLNLKKDASLDRVSKYFDAAQENDHASVVKLIAQYGGLEATLPIFKICVYGGRANFCQAFIDVFGLKLATVIDADPILRAKPIIRNLMHEFYMKMYKHYEN